MGSKTSTMVKGQNVNIVGGTFTAINNQPAESAQQQALSHANVQSVRPASLQGMPSKPRIFHGRDGVVQEVTNFLCDPATSRVCILGPGGMGKTSLALAVMESTRIQSRYGGRCFWVPCIEATTPSLLLYILHVHLRIKTRGADNVLDNILSNLNRSKKPLLLLLDNFETPWFPIQGTQSEVSNILHRISHLGHVSILVTMRGNPPCDEIQWQAKTLYPVDKEASRLIFHDVYPRSKHDPDVDDLLAAVGYMPYAVMLMAKLGKQASSSAKELLDDWKKVGTGMMTLTAPEDNMERCIRLSIDRPFVRQNPDALALLATLSLLPAGTSQENLSRWWAPSMKLSLVLAIAMLSEAALLLTNDREGAPAASRMLFVLPVVQSFMFANCIPNDVRQHIQAAGCRYIFDHIAVHDNLHFTGNSIHLAAEDTNIRSIFLTSNSRDFLVPLDNVVEALLHFSRYCWRTRPSVNVAQHALDLANSLGQPQYQADALYVLGITYAIMSRFDLAEQSFAKSYSILMRTDHSSPKLTALTAECGCRLAESKWFNRGESIESTISSLRNLLSEFGPRLDDYGRAGILKLLGHYLCSSGHDVAEGLDNLHEAKDLFKRMRYMGGVAESLMRMSVAYRQSFHLTEAEQSSREAFEAGRELGGWFHMQMRFEHGRNLIAFGRDAEAFPIVEGCVKDFDLSGDMLHTARCWELLGFIHTKTRDYHNASSAYNAAIGKYAEVGRDNVGVERCRENLDRIKEGNHCPPKPLP